jgi:hypothetical protein
MEGSVNDRFTYETHIYCECHSARFEYQWRKQRRNLVTIGCGSKGNSICLMHPNLQQSPEQCWDWWHSSRPSGAAPSNDRAAASIPAVIRRARAELHLIVWFWGGGGPWRSRARIAPRDRPFATDTWPLASIDLPPPPPRSAGCQLDVSAGCKKHERRHGMSNQPLLSITQQLHPHHVGPLTSIRPTSHPHHISFVNPHISPLNCHSPPPSPSTHTTMLDLIRDATFGSLVNFASGGKIFPFNEQRAD